MLVFLHELAASCPLPLFDFSGDSRLDSLIAVTVYNVYDFQDIGPQIVKKGKDFLYTPGRNFLLHVKHANEH